MRLLLGSGGFRTTERVARLRAQMQSFFGELPELLFIPYALHDYDEYVQMIQKKGIDAGYRLKGIHRCPDPVEAIEQAEAVFVGGGNSFRLLTRLYEFDLLGVIRSRVRDGMPYMGVSAGANMACPTLKTTNDMPIVMPPSFDALNLIPFQINPHYYSGINYVKANDEFIEHFGETRDERIAEFHEMNEAPVLGLWEAGILRIEDERVTLLGTPARIFRKNAEPKDVPEGSVFDLQLRLV